MSEENQGTQETQTQDNPTQGASENQGGQESQGGQEDLMKSTLLDDGSGDKEGGETDGETKADEPPAKKDGEAKPPEEAPENYEAFKDIDGNEYAAESVRQFADAAKEAGLSQEKAQKLFEAMVPTARTHMLNDLRSKAEQWALDCEKDPEIGGANFGANKAVAIAGYREFATPELRAILNASGLGNHPEVVRHFYRLGKTMQQDTGVHGGASSAQAPRRRYPNSNMVVDE